MDRLPYWPFYVQPSVAETLRHLQFVQSYGLYQVAKRFVGTPAFGIETIHTESGEPVPVSVTVVAHTPFCRLLHFSARTCTDNSVRPKLMLCTPQAGHPAALMRAVVRSLLDDSDVYVTEWIDARDIPVEAGALNVNNHVLTLESFMSGLGPGELDVLAICQATVPALAAAARLAASGGPELRSLALMGGPIDARIHPTALGRAARELSREWFAQRCTGRVPLGYAGAGRRVYPGFLQFSAQAGDPSRQVGRFLEAMCHVSRGDVGGIVASVAEVADHSAPLDLPAEFIESTIDVVFRRFLLPRGKWRVDGALVRLDCLRKTRLLTVEGADDAITGAQQTHAAHALCTQIPSSYRDHITLSQCNHYGLFSGNSWSAEVYPMLRRRLAVWRGMVDRD